MKFLIVTEPNDYHALLVKRGLEETGHLARLLFPADQPTRQKNTVFLDNHIYQWTSSDARNAISDNVYDVVWWRRVRKPYVPRNLVHPDDYHIVLRENTLFYEALTSNMAPDAWWVNSKEAARKATSKLFQLKMAALFGMNIPQTLCGNDPDNIRDFVEYHEEQGVIYKPLSPNFWCGQQQAKMAFTSKITRADLPHDHLLQYAPGLYQEEIKKLYELRVTCFGEYLVAIKLDSQNHPQGKIDWRIIPDGELVMEPYELPPDLQDKIQKFMKKMGLVFGAMDFIVTEDGEYYFLEVNEQGQFLWIEDFYPESMMLDIFVNFLINRSVKFKWNPRKSRHHMAHYLDDVDKWVVNNLQYHVDVNHSAILSQQ